jgi:hypothetical protein
MRRNATNAHKFAPVMVVVLGLGLAACGSSSKSSSAASAPGETSTKRTDAPAGGGSTSAVCKLLTDDEVTGVIGAHTKGASGIETGGEYGDFSCVWKSTNTSGSYVDSAEVAMLSGTDADAAREDAARAAPLDSFGHGARFDKSYGRLWFECGQNAECQVRVATGSVTDHSGDSREAAAIKLARRVLTRV